MGGKERRKEERREGGRGYIKGSSLRIISGYVSLTV